MQVQYFQGTMLNTALLQYRDQSTFIHILYDLRSMKQNSGSSQRKITANDQGEKHKYPSKDIYEYIIMTLNVQ